MSQLILQSLWRRFFRSDDAYERAAQRETFPNQQKCNHVEEQEVNLCKMNFSRKRRELKRFSRIWETSAFDFPCLCWWRNGRRSHIRKCFGFENCDKKTPIRMKILGKCEINWILQKHWNSNPRGFAYSCDFSVSDLWLNSKIGLNDNYAIGLLTSSRVGGAFKRDSSAMLSLVSRVTLDASLALLISCQM